MLIAKWRSRTKGGDLFIYKMDLVINWFTTAEEGLVKGKEIVGMEVKCGRVCFSWLKKGTKSNGRMADVKVTLK